MFENHLVLLLEHLLQTQAVVSLVVDVYEFNEFRGFPRQVPQEAVGFVTGRAGNFLRSIEES